MANWQPLRKFFTTACRWTSPAGAGVTSSRILLTSLNKHSNNVFTTNFTRGLATKPSDKNSNTQKVKKTSKVEQKKEKTVAATKKGVAVLDPWIPDEIKSNYHVCKKGSKIYDATLSQTHLGANMNKFIIMQLLESDPHPTQFHNKLSYYLYQRWGRVGIKGQTKLYGPFDDDEEACDMFSYKFYEKTKIDFTSWNSQATLDPSSNCPNRYTPILTDYTNSVGNDDGTSPLDVDKPMESSKLDPRVANFISLIFNDNMMVKQMAEIGYDANKLPLGKLSKLTILKGYKVLKSISNVIEEQQDKTTQNKLEELSGEFYTVIPHDFGFRKMREFVINTPEKLRQKLEMVEALNEIEVAKKVLSSNSDSQEDPLYSYYQHLKWDLTPISDNSEEFAMIAEYIENTRDKRDHAQKPEIAQVFKTTSRTNLPDDFDKFSQTKNRMLLWHGSRLTNWASILSKVHLSLLGLQIAPPEAPHWGYMFGKGVYFADMFSKSKGYSFFSNSDCKDGILLLCEVALGEMVELEGANYNANDLPPGKLSTKGLGRREPNPKEGRTLEDGIVPLGCPVDLNDHKRWLWHNEYIVYDLGQIRMRYLIHIKIQPQN